MKEVLSTGPGTAPPRKPPFHVQFTEGWTAQAQSVGLEASGPRRAGGKYGSAFSGQLGDYFIYLDGLLKPAPWTGELRSALSELKNSQLPAGEKNARLNAMLENYVSGLQANMERYDGAAWAKKARIYELFPRAYNLDGRRDAQGFKAPAKTLFFRDFRSSDFDVIKRMGFDTVWPMGILPIGVRGQTGTGGGSPFHQRPARSTRTWAPRRTKFHEKGSPDRAESYCGFCREPYLA